MTWEQLYKVLTTFPATYPPLNNECEAWLWQIREKPLSSDFYAFNEWLSRILAGQESAARFPAPMPPLNPHLWRVQADQVEDNRESCPDGEWLTAYVAHMHRCADIIEAILDLNPRRATA